MKEAIQAGIFSKILDTIKSVSQAFCKFIDKFSSYGIEITKSEETDNGGTKLWCKYGTKNFGIIIAPTGEKSKVNLTVYYNGKNTELKAVSEFDIEKKAKELLNNIIEIDFDDKSSESADSSRTLKVTLQKVTSARDCTINLTAVNANYAPDEASAVLDTVLDNEDFLNTITEEPASFEITEDEDELNIRSIPEFDVTETIQNIKTTYEKFCTETRALVDMLEFYYSNFSYEEQEEIDRFIDGINNCTMSQFGSFAD